jgi:hypothetical protein
MARLKLTRITHAGDEEAGTAQLTLLEPLNGYETELGLQAIEAAVRIRAAARPGLAAVRVRGAAPG